MIKIEVKDEFVNLEIHGSFSEVMTELTLALCSVCKKVGEGKNMHPELVKSILIAGWGLVDTRAIEMEEVDDPSGSLAATGGTMRASSPTIYVNYGKRPTNYEWIKNASKEELARFLVYIGMFGGTESDSEMRALDFLDKKVPVGIKLRASDSNDKT